MARYRLRVQLVHWYELILPSASGEDAVVKAEALSPRQISARGRCVQVETGLADPASAEAVESK
jgi:hypothetical protein